MTGDDGDVLSTTFLEVEEDDGDDVSMTMMTWIMMTCSIPTTSWMKNLKEIWTRLHARLSNPIT
jgi:hypothetical protein